MQKLLIILSCFVSAIIATNPFLEKLMYVNPTYKTNIQSSLSTSTDPTILNNLKIAQNIPSAYWLDTISKVQLGSVTTDTAEGILRHASSQIPIPLVTMIVYDLPDRDCSARASNGEIKCVDSACFDGINKYKQQYIDSLVYILKKYQNVPVVLIIEPDSLPNLVTNMGITKCAGAANVYKVCVKYAIDQLSQLSNVNIYVDGAHGGWLGWTNNAQPFASLIVVEAWSFQQN